MECSILVYTMEETLQDLFVKVRALLHESFHPGRNNPGMNSSQYLVISLLLFTWLWGGMSSSWDELTSLPGNFLAAIYMALGWDELIPG